MSINIETIGNIPYDVAPTDQFQSTIDISTWLDGDTIADITFTAVDDNGDDATETALDADLCTFTDTIIKPYVLGGTDGVVYTIKCAVVTANGDKKSFYVKWVCDE
jgi:hypothetical protein